MELSHLNTQYDRLKRHYCAAVKNREDEIGLLDLAHSLRIWVDMKHVATTLAQDYGFEPVFGSYTVPKKVKKVLRGKKYTYLPLSSGVERSTGSAKGVRKIEGELSPDDIKALYEAGPPQQIPSKMNFVEWLAAAVYDVPSEDPKHPKLSISREILIKRVANVLGASHPAGMEEGEPSENRFDPFILTLHNTWKVDGYPASYYQMLEIAKDIVEAFKNLREDAT